MKPAANGCQRIICTYLISFQSMQHKTAAIDYPINRLNKYFVIKIYRNTEKNIAI
jgi:hypothetical protein